MILWLTGNTGAGKTTYAHKMKDMMPTAVILDGDSMRDVWPGLTMENDNRIENNMRIARLALIISDQGFDVIVAAICPFESLRLSVKKLIDCKFMYVEGGASNTEETPYEIPTSPDFIVRRAYDNTG